MIWVGVYMTLWSVYMMPRLLMRKLRPLSGSRPSAFCLAIGGFCSGGRAQLSREDTGCTLSSRIETGLGWCGRWRPGCPSWISLFRRLWAEGFSGSHIIMDQGLWREVKFLLNPIYCAKLPSEVSRPECWERAASSKWGGRRTKARIPGPKSPRSQD